LWSFEGARIAVRFAYEARDGDGQWFRAYGNENWEFAADGLMALRHASINDLAITEGDRLFRWPLGPRTEGPPGLTELGL
jgi:nuclear transport factor 2 (NTF2) superfamily protein